jgi:hypothetical protein
MTADEGLARGLRASLAAKEALRCSGTRISTALAVQSLLHRQPAHRARRRRTVDGHDPGSTSRSTRASRAARASRANAPAHTGVVSRQPHQFQPPRLRQVQDPYSLRCQPQVGASAIRSRARARAAARGERGHRQAGVRRGARDKGAFRRQLPRRARGVRGGTSRWPWPKSARCPSHASRCLSTPRCPAAAVSREDGGVNPGFMIATSRPRHWPRGTNCSRIGQCRFLPAATRKITCP